MSEFEGTSDSSNFQEALESALRKALSTVRHTDPMVSYVVKSVRGARGGIAHFNSLTVVIETDHAMATRETKTFALDPCEVCGKKHRVTIEYTPLFVTMQWPNPQHTSRIVEYRCPEKGKTVQFSASFSGPVKDVEVVAVENA